MGKLTAEQVKRLADNFAHMANALGNYRYENFERLTKENNQFLKELHAKTLAHTTELYTQSAILVMDDAASSLEHIDSITLETQQLYKKLVGVQKILDRATSVLTLASAIISLDTKEITNSVKKLLTPES
ncbi:hypothetical protein [uncultured Kriegella sp.]|uniref:hypothetical protein n=1 Tax=uncultured Kriegella sp. TaxID=1798910 RepID=UPI0030D97E14|tara:strand:- start:88356 stop:88745 length:390 start_codon:yes stop_codon:yes gene_type:complete